MSNSEYSKIPQAIYERDGPFKEFKQDASIVTVKLQDGDEYQGVLVLYPIYIIGVQGHKSLPFNPNQIESVKQTSTDLGMRSDSSWVLFSYPGKPHAKSI
ncbi:hypothetical protein KUV95_06670 [Microbulbifer agarilyticus]|uniref:hypothetical protein n=1 Tax=Microbulbifer agarilyticus TaxID=260552 RepID=UPI001C954E6B|nr:hypothetical protein [Microbulbifer agarilyticus]MBY6211231.1 hypothetical protein [Microbulbifer agarilyticus]